MTDIVFPSQHWAYLFGQPTATAKLKTQPDDFVVEEILGYDLSGAGEHSYVHLEKTELNTAFVAEQLAKYCKLPLRQVTYAGRKDKFARTTQYFGIHHPKQALDLSGFALSNARILGITKHHKKLKTGHLQGNRFTLILRDVSHQAEIDTRLEAIKNQGVPNYYGQQRFGEMHYVDELGQAQIKYGGNLALAQYLIDDVPIKQRNKRNLAISALRSWLFNTLISQRISRGLFEQPLAGDAFSLAGSNSFFVPESHDDEIQTRLLSGDIHISGALYGAGALASQSDALAFESNLFEQYTAICATLDKLGLKQERRAIRLLPTGLEWHWHDNTLTLSFELPKGCFATSIIRELCQWGA